MSLPHHPYDPRRVFVVSCPSLPFIKHRRTVGVYLAGVLVCLYPSQSPSLT
jgi:hypothetical protein